MCKIVFFAGKGGVGKTTCSAAFAYNCAQSGKKTLLVSTDPAHSVGDLFEMKIGNGTTKIKDNLDCMEINSQIECKKYMQGVKDSLKNVVSPVIVKEIKKQIDTAYVSPGTEEAALFDKMVEIINEESIKYDKIVFDTAPTGHTLRLVALPELLGEWVKSLIKKRKKALGLRQMADNKGKKDKNEIENDPVIKILKKRYENMEKVKKILTSSKSVDFIYVLNAERLPIEETKKAVDVLKKYNIEVNKLVVNRLIPDDVDGQFMMKKKELEEKNLEEIIKQFKNKTLIKIPMFPYDIKMDNIHKISQYF